MICKNCGYKNKNKATFCIKCGEFIIKKKPFYKRASFWIPISCFAALVAVALGYFLGKRGEPEPEVAEIIEEEIIEEDTPAFRTVLVYMIGSNLESQAGLASEDIEEMLAADLEDNINIIIQTGGSTAWKNHHIDDGKVQRFQIVNGKLEELKDLGTISMVEKSTLTDFIKYGKKKFPAESYTLVMWDHGGSVPIGFGSDELFPGELTDIEIGEALRESKVHFDALIFNACEMCSLELFMSVKDSVDYVVAAESVLYGYNIYGSGIDYESWLPLACKEDVSTQQFCESILDDYMKFLDSISCPGSMSVIRMDRIDEVYDAYKNYITAVYNDFESDEYAYAAFVQARDNCGAYEGTDSVDICTLATKYENDYSTALINAVTNAVVRTKSDISYGHGITAYSPYENAMYYTDGRISFENLAYDDTILAFYDLLSSKLLYYNGLTAYAGDWYVEQYDDIDHGQEYDLAYTDMGDYYAIALTEEDWSIVKNIDMWVFQDLYDPDFRYIYGVDAQYTCDKNQYIKVSRPSYWLFINDYIPTSLCYEYEETEDGWYQSTIAYAYVNGEEAYLRVDSSNDNPNGSVVCYYLCDWETEELDEGHNITEDDVIQLVAITVDEYGIDYTSIGEELNGTDLTCTWPSLDYKENEEVLVYYKIYDVYGNVYTTDIIAVTE